MLTKMTVLCVALLGLAACQNAPTAPKYPQLTWRHLPSYNLSVSNIEVVNEYQPPLKAPNVDHLFPQPPVDVMARWSSDRLKARGGSATARVIISDASVVENRLKKKEGITGAVTTDQSERYDGKINVTMEIRSGREFREAFVHAAAARTRTVPEDITLNEREKVWFEMTEAMMKDINRQLEQAIPQYFQRWLN
jgi:hypothetical protein